MNSRRRVDRNKGDTVASVGVTHEELVALLADLKKIDPEVKFTGQGQYIALVGSYDWSAADKEKMEEIFVLHDWKVKLA